MAVIEPAGIMVDVPSLIGRCIVRIINCAGILLLQSQIILLARQSFRIRVLTVRTHVLIILCRLIRIVRLFLESLPSLLANQRVTILFILLGIVLEKCR